jgi:phosphoribosylaminoimidazolecarboxamide formyltransferase/IMP cyclohydrolase
MTEHRRRALLSVSDKNGIAELGQALASRGWELLSTGGTARVLREAGLEVTNVSDVTGHPEIMDGRVKTLHPAIHGPLLARLDREGDRAALDEHGYVPIDWVVVNLYPFRETIAKGDVSVGEAMEKVDIGGPTMIRAAAKNHRFVWVTVDPSDYARVIASIDAEEGAEDETALRQALAAKVFDHVSGYDRAVSDFLSGGRGTELRYGENPDQPASFHADSGDVSGLAGLEQLHGKALSYNNYLDLDGALLSLAPFAFSPDPAVCIVKHTTPCGLATGESLRSAFERALATDSTSAFGSVIALNRTVDAAAAEALAKLFVECIVAPGYAADAFELLTAKKNVRLLTMPEMDASQTDASLPEGGPAALAGLSEDAAVAARFLVAQSAGGAMSSRSVYGGMLEQTTAIPPWVDLPAGEWSVVTERAPSPDEEADLRFAWGAVFGVKSNAILLARGRQTLGIGAGQMSRVDSSKLAVRKAGDADIDLAGCSLASDAFFPFRDGVDAAAEAGVRAIVQPGGSRRDDEVIQAANEHGIAMVFTGRRLFRH